MKATLRLNLLLPSGLNPYSRAFHRVVLARGLCLLVEPVGRRTPEAKATPAPVGPAQAAPRRWRQPQQSQKSKMTTAADAYFSLIAAVSLPGFLLPERRLATRPNFVAVHCPTIQRKIAVLSPAKQVLRKQAQADADGSAARILLESANAQTTSRLSLADI